MPRPAPPGPPGLPNTTRLGLPFAGATLLTAISMSLPEYWLAQSRGAVILAQYVRSSLSPHCFHTGLCLRYLLATGCGRSTTVACSIDAVALEPGTTRTAAADSPRPTARVRYFMQTPANGLA